MKQKLIRPGTIRTRPVWGKDLPRASDERIVTREEVLSFAEITPAVIQNENHIFYQNAELRDYVKQYGIVMASWYPFGGRGHTQEA